MPDEFFALKNVNEVESAADLVVPRARALYDAVERHRDFTAVQLLKSTTSSGGERELLVVDVTCDGVPPRNAAGIRYRERLLLCVSDNPKRLVEVLALRKDFPTLMHQNQGDIGAPASLCLYFEPVATVTRTWTPQNFLRRIQWWLEKSATGELHPADQPVEQLFFVSRYELIFPWNFESLRSNPDLRFILTRRTVRPDEGFSCFLEATQRNTSIGVGTSSPVELTLPPVVHGFVERHPATLGELADTLARREVDLLASLSAELQSRVGSDGARANPQDNYTIILLHIPIARTEAHQPATTTHQAFIAPIGELQLGVNTGALISHDNRYYSAAGVMSPETPSAWREQPVFAMDVLRQNDVSAARRQSGIHNAGPGGVLIGAGSLGSALANLWGRAGWGKWTVIDKDHVKPHNLSRHVAHARQIGQPKATVVADLHAAHADGATQIQAVNADACDFDLAEVGDALRNNALVVDASTTLEYPRAASAIDDLARQMSVFLTPSGNAAVLLAEDTRRTVRLRTLEAQYYRALVQEEWGRTHLDGSGGTFWSGASCRDISMVLPYSRIMGHASTLAEQVPIAFAQETAVIRAWQRNPDDGTVAVHDVPTCAEHRLALGDFDLFIDSGVEEQLKAARTRAFPNETGGALLGYYDFNINAVIVVLGLPPPPDSTSTPTSFERGVRGLADVVAEASRRTAGIVGYIGEWHSHPPGHSASHSRDDLVQLVHLALGMADDGLPAVQLIVGEGELQVLQATVK
ncbi:ThiF family adenylyltransferase [Burkholderia gladioli]|uniref:ThiF family adenylyltransferase n=1 Tax=Burkholderia gladioli TaxID=28095 RepID=UPI001641001D|nr:ThiF family adenylyltransferase [Burkholderia gladioli]MDN7805803.1 ThiF family adenylyltransferase [Burkholderia gladioli]